MATKTADRVQILALARITRDPEIQPRERLNQDAVTQYAEDMLAGIEFPPVVVYFDGEDHWLSQGFHRTRAAIDAYMETIPAIVRNGSREDALWDAIGSNREHDRAGLRRTNADKRVAVEMAVKAFRKTKSNVEIADRVGVVEGFVRKIKKTIFVQNEDTPSEVEVTRNGTTYTMQTGAIGHTPTTAPEPEELFTLAAPAAVAEVKAAHATFNATNEMVDWARWTWNPVTGCEHTCVYCYARDIANRFYPEKFVPTFRPERLSAPRNTTYPETAKTETPWRNVFVCSMADLFGRWVPEQWIDDVFASCRKSPEWNYLFLTKFPQRYVGLDFPETAWVGTSVDEQKRVANAEKAFGKIDVPVKWLSVEPMTERIAFKELGVFDWVVIGGQSRSSGAPEFHPEPWWVIDLAWQAREAGCKVYLKPNTFRDNGWQIKEYPY